MPTAMLTPRLRAEIEGPESLDDAGVAKLTITNSGSTPDVYRLTVDTEFHSQASADPAMVRLEPGHTSTVIVASHAPVAVRVYSQVSGQRVSELYLSR